MNALARRLRPKPLVGYAIAGGINWLNRARPYQCSSLGADLRLWMEGYVTFALSDYRRDPVLPAKFHAKHPTAPLDREGEPWTAAEWMFLYAVWPTEVPVAWVAWLLGRKENGCRMAARAVGLQRQPGGAR